MKHLLLLIVFTLHTCTIVCFSQTLDSVQVISPGLSPAIVRHGQVELALFNQLSTEKSRFEFNTIKTTSRFSALYHVLQAGYGVSKHNRVNVGGLFIFAHTRSDAQADRSPFAVLSRNDDYSSGFHRMAAVGLYARGIPLRRLPELTIQAGVLFPATRDLLARQFSGYDRVTAQVQGAFYQHFKPWFYAFATMEVDVQFANADRRQTSVALPINLYPVFRLGYYSKTYLFGSLGYTGRFSRVNPGFLKSNGYRVQYGVGVQYYFQPQFSLYAQAQLPAAVGSPSITTTTLKQGTYVLSLGARLVL